MNSSPDANQTLFERLGGQEQLVKMIDEFYDRITSHDSLGPYFQAVPSERLRNMQFQFLAAAFGGPVYYSGSELTAAHANRGIGSKQFSEFCGLFADVLEDFGVSARDVTEALARLSTFKDKVTGDATVDG